MKVLYVDVETTGLDPRRHGIHQLAYIIEVDGEVKVRAQKLIRPFPSDLIEEKALAISGTTRDMLASEMYLDPRIAWGEVRADWDQWIDKYNREDKFVLSGYNVDSFDQQFVREFIRKCEPDKGFSVAGTYIGHLTMDPLPLLKWYKALRTEKWMESLPNLKLATVCQALGIELEQAHNALADLDATRSLVKLLSAHLREGLEGRDLK